MADNLTNPESVSTSAGHSDGVSLLPWQVRYVDVVADATGAKVAACFRHANAALIVEAVNNYHPLIQERRRLIGELDAAKAHADSEERWANEYFEAKAAAEAEGKRLRDLVRRMIPAVEEAFAVAKEMGESVKGICALKGVNSSEVDVVLNQWTSLLDEARAALGKEEP
jgi:hypothetical protein